MLIDDLESDGKLKVGVLQERYEEWVQHDNFFSVVAEAIASSCEDLEYNAGTLLKHHLFQDGELPDEEWAQIIDALSPRMHWVCQLALCQALIRQPDTLSRNTVLFADFLRGVATSKNSFVRAFSISAFWALASAHSDYEEEARDMRERGRSDPAKCVRTRMKHLREFRGKLKVASKW